MRRWPARLRPRLSRPLCCTSTQLQADSARQRRQNCLWGLGFGAVASESHTDGDSHHRFSIAGKICPNRRLSVVGWMLVLLGDASVWSPSAKCGCGCRLLPSKALLYVLFVVAGLRIPLNCFARRVARGTRLTLRGGCPEGECRGRPARERCGRSEGECRGRPAREHCGRSARERCGRSEGECRGRPAIER